MKKFNAILAIATVALTSVFGFTSCQQDDVFDDGGVSNPVPPTDPNGNPDANRKSNGTVDLEFFVSDEVLSLGEYTLTVKQPGGETVIDMASCENYSHYYNNKGYEKTFTGKKYVINDLKPGTVITPAFKAFDGAFESLLADGYTDVMILCDVSVNGNDDVLNTYDCVKPKLKNARVETVINKYTNAMAFTVK